MKKLHYGFCFIFIAVLVCSCFSPWQGDEDQGNNLTIRWGDATDSSGRFVDSILRNDVVLISLTGPGDTINQGFIGGASLASFTVVPGTWTATVKISSLSKFGNVLKLMGIEQIEVEAGKKTEVKFNLYTASEIGTWKELEAAINDPTNNNPDNFFPKIKLGPGIRTELFLLTESLIEVGEPITIIRPIILVAEKRVALASTTEDDPFVFGGQDGSLTVGLPGMTGDIRLLVNGKQIKWPTKLRP